SGRGGLQGDAAPQAGGTVASVFVYSAPAAPARGKISHRVEVDRNRAEPARTGVQGARAIEGGLFVTFEGVEGAGKSTQVRLLHEYLSNTMIPFVFTREPGGTPLGEKLRTLLIDPLHQMAPEAEALILSASRAELVDKVIEPSLREGRVVVCDRFWDATLAYQGFGRELPIDSLMQLTMFAARKLEPDLTFLLDVPVRVSQARI